jgi:hypothetical protein
MPLPDYPVVSIGANPIIWGPNGASGVTHDLSLDALADGTAQMGVYADLGATRADTWGCMLIVETGTAPAAGKTADLYFAESYTNGSFPGGVSGSDAAWPADSNEDEWAKQLRYMMSLVATNDGNVTQIQAPIRFRPTGRYIAPVVDNNLGVAFMDTTPNSNNTSRVIIWQIIDSIVD